MTLSDHRLRSSNDILILQATYIYPRSTLAREEHTTCLLYQHGLRSKTGTTQHIVKTPNQKKKKKKHKKYWITRFSHRNIQMLFIFPRNVFFFFFFLFILLCVVCSSFVSFIFIFPFFASPSFACLCSGFYFCFSGRIKETKKTATK